MKILLLIACLLVVALAKETHEYIELSPEETETARKALHNPDLYDGDMAGIDPRDPSRSAVVGNHLRWPGGVVPYVIDRSLGNAANLIKQGIDDYHRNTCIRFKQRTNEQNYIRIFAGQGCYSMIGKVGGAQPLSLGQGCLYVGTIIHEFGHALGFYHEQSRSDRDQYLIIYLQNVDKSMQGQFFKLTPQQNILYNAFDYNSIMIYGNKSFSKNGQDTMRARNGQKLLDPFNKRSMTRSDVERFKKMYNCR